MPNSLDGRLALIIGGSGSISATAELFAPAGAQIVVTHTSRPAVSAAALAEAVLGCTASLRFSTGTAIVVDGGRSR
jgi:NAD(P)-dependent dehydrogenase (short-subunit alcohol dehydrogenase family)